MNCSFSVRDVVLARLRSRVTVCFDICSSVGLLIQAHMIRENGA
jgi:hypothetical protein